ncbi:DUF3237 domain-containing protein [Azospirillum sp.]|uniref:DUF3237 domain-containing protein n=1 Tax=Azospirillum sp. TaxID=34012 RepID=UPI003D71A8DC
MEPTFRPLFRIRFDLMPLQSVGGGLWGKRRVAPIAGGDFAGDRLRGTVLPGGSDAYLIGSDGSLRLDVRCVLETHDSAKILMTYGGFFRASADAQARLRAGEPVEPGSVYLRVAPVFETGADAYQWLNGMLFIGIGSLGGGATTYDVYEVL